MANLTNYAQKKLLDLTIHGTAFSMPETWLALFTASPGETGSLAAELSGGGYDRVALEGASPDIAKMAATVLGTGICANDEAITFASPSSDWPAVTYCGVIDAATAGNVLLYFPLAETQVKNAGDPALEFVPGSLNIFALIDDPSQLTQYLAKKWMDHLMGIAEFSAPSGLFLGMFGADPTSAGSLDDEIATGSYGRQAITALMEETVLTTGISINEDSIQFPSPTANYSTTHFGIMDAAAAGNMLFRKARTSTLNVTSGGAAVHIASGQLALRAA